MLSELLQGSWNSVTQQWLIALSGGAAVLFLGRLVRRSLSGRISDVDARYRTRKFVTLTSYVLATFVIASVFQRELGGFSVALGMAGAGIAFALQEIVVSVAGWVAISLGGFYAPGDRVQVGGIKGDVIDVSILRTTLMEVGEWVTADQYSGRIVRIANSFVFKEPVFNYSGDFPFLWDEITLPVRYGSDWTAARTMLLGIAQETLTEYAKEVRSSWKNFVKQFRLPEEANVEPVVTLTATDNWIEFKIRYVVDYRKRRWMKDHLFTRILEEVDRSENRIRLASATFEMVTGSNLDVRIAGCQGLRSPAGDGSPAVGNASQSSG